MSVQPAMRYRLASKARLVFDAARGRHMLIYPERGLELNDVGRAIVELCDGQTSVARMSELLAGRFEHADAEIIARDVTAFLTQLEQRGVIVGEE